MKVIKFVQGGQPLSAAVARILQELIAAGHKPMFSGGFTYETVKPEKKKKKAVEEESKHVGTLTLTCVVAAKLVKPRRLPEGIKYSLSAGHTIITFSLTLEEQLTKVLVKFLEGEFTIIAATGQYEPETSKMDLFFIIENKNGIKSGSRVRESSVIIVE